MGMYTEFRLDVTLDTSQSEKWAYILCYMLDNNFTKPDNHYPWMKSGRWEWMFNTSDYEEGNFSTPSRLVKNRLTVKSYIKNYDSEINGFLEWLSPYVLELHEGAYQYEEDDEESKIILKDKALWIDYVSSRPY